jgi:hypothetical protein
VRDEAKRGLRPFVHHHVDIISDSAQPYPSFVDLAQFLSKQVAKRMEGVNDKNALPFPAASYEESLSFLLKCLRNNIQRSGRTWSEYLAELSSAGDCLTLYRYVSLGSVQPSASRRPCACAQLVAHKLM